MKELTGSDNHGKGSRQSAGGWLRYLAILLIAIQITACSKQSDSPKQPAKPPEPKNQTYRMTGGRSVISLVSSDELEIREGGQNIVCKYTKQDGKLRVVVNALGTTTAKYFNMTPQGLVDEDGDIYYEPATYEKVMAQIELNSQLWAAVERDDSATIDELIRKGAVVETRDNRRTALVMAIEEGKTNAVATLLKNGAHPDRLFNANGSLPLLIAIEKGNSCVVQLLLKHGATPNAKRDNGSTALMIAAGFKGNWDVRRKPEHDKIVALLCESKADLNTQDNDGYSALGLSLRSGNLEAAKILVAAGADRNTGKDTGHDAFTLAQADKGKTDAIRTPSEREARDKLFAQYPKLIVGVWRDENSVMTFNADGTRSVMRDEQSSLEKGTWSIAEDELSTERYRASIIELTESSFVFKDSGGEWHAKRVTEDELEAERAKLEKIKQMFVGSWRDADNGYIYRFKADGTMEKNGEANDGTWSSDGRTFTTLVTWKIKSITDDSFHLTHSWSSWKATKVR